MNKVNIQINADQPIKPFRHFYRAFGYANADYTYTPPALKMYKYLSSYNNHCKYMRLHNILSAHGKGDYYLVTEGLDYGGRDGSIVYFDKEGEMKFDWTTVDRVYDILVAHDMKPIVETVYIPRPLRKSEEYYFLPKDFNAWHKLIKAFVEHVQQRYGKNEVETWYFEIWNEPDNHKLWREENPQSFFALYDYMEDAVHSVNDKIKVGGPATKQEVYLPGALNLFNKFLDHCVNGVNYVTGEYGTRIDFISVHCKGAQPGLNCPSTEYMFHSLKEYVDIMKQYPQLEGIEFVNDESDISWKGHMGVQQESWFNFRNTHYFPGFVCKMVDTYCSVIEDQYGVNLSIVDSDNCHIQWEKSLFSGHRSQLTPLVKYSSTDLILKSSFNGYVLLNHLGDERLQISSSDEGFGKKFGALPTLKDNSLSIMVWNFEDGMDDNVNHRQVNIHISDIPFSGQYRQIHYRIDKDHSNAYDIWMKMGSPQSPSVEQIKELRIKEGLELYEEVKDISLAKNTDIELNMPMHSVSLIKLVPRSTQSPLRPMDIESNIEQGYNGNKQIFLKWKPNEEDDFLYYKVWRKKEFEQDYTLIHQHLLNISLYVDMDIEKGSYIYRIQSVNASQVESRYSDEIIIDVN